MSILIKGMEMPQNCLSCPLQGGTADCRLTQKTYNWGLNERPSDCLLIPVPPHGRLIDADAPIEVWEVKLSDGDSCSFRNIETTVSKFLLSHLMGEVPPTIIPAEPFNNLSKPFNEAEEGE